MRCGGCARGPSAGVCGSGWATLHGALLPDAATFPSCACYWLSAIASVPIANAPAVPTAI